MTNVGYIFVTWLFGTISPAPRYTSATIVLLVFQVGTILCAAANRTWLGMENRKRVMLRGAMTPPRGDESDVGKGDESIWFEYVL